MSGPTSRIIDGKAIARQIYAKVDEGVAELSQHGHQPHLVAVQIGSDSGSTVYIRRQREHFARHGIDYTLRALPETVSEAELTDAIIELNCDPRVTGVILMMPLPPGFHAASLQEAIRPDKDVEGVNPANLGRLIYNRHAVGPCTALAVMECIDFTGIAIRGQNVVIVGHSDIVGKPVGLCLLQAFATITTCHVATRDLARHTREADILITAVGKPRLIRGDMVREGAIVIDVGINRTADGIVGDVAYDEVAERASWITPVPGGVGPVTVAMLARNTLICSRKLAGV